MVVDGWSIVGRWRSMVVDGWSMVGERNSGEKINGINELTNEQTVQQREFQLEILLLKFRRGDRWLNWSTRALCFEHFFL